MQPFTYHRPASLPEALHLASAPGAALLAGGTTIVDMMRGDLVRPASIVDIGHLPDLATIDAAGPTIRIGALARMADVAEHPGIYPALQESLALAASQQLRNAATIGGNLLQRTRCFYFRDGVSACNKREPGAGCTAQDGLTRDMALFGGSGQCIATYPGDWATALAAFDTSIEIASANGTRTIPFGQLHVPYGEDPAAETTLQPGEIITAILIAPTKAGPGSTYLKIRDRQSYAYAVVSAAVALHMDGPTIHEARVAIGGVATRPWRSHAAEAALNGRTLTPETALAAGRAAFAEAVPRGENAFKIELGARAIARAAQTASGRS